MILVAGEALIDLIVDPDGSLAAVPGGGPYNTARAIARLGRPVAFLGALSTDRFGRMLTEQLRADGVDLSLAPVVDLPSTLALAELDGSGAASYRFYISDTSAPAVTAVEPPAGLAVLHVGTLGLVMEPMASTLLGLVRSVGDEVLVMVDPNCRPTVLGDPTGTQAQHYRTRLGQVLQRADVVKVSADDLEYLAPGVEPDLAAAQLLAEPGGTGPAVVLLTDGGAAMRVITRAGEQRLAVPRVPVVDSVGAGDSFGGGFLASWRHAGLGRADLTDIELVVAAARFGIEVAGITVQRAGANPPYLAEVSSPLPVRASVSGRLGSAGGRRLVADGRLSS